MDPLSKKLLEQVPDGIQRKHYSPRTHESYVHWTKRYILFHDKHHSLEMVSTEVNPPYLVHYLLPGPEVVQVLLRLSLPKAGIPPSFSDSSFQLDSTFCGPYGCYTIRLVGTKDDGDCPCTIGIE